MNMLEYGQGDDANFMNMRCNTPTLNESACRCSNLKEYNRTPRNVSSELVGLIFGVTAQPAQRSSLQLGADTHTCRVFG